MIMISCIFQISNIVKLGSWSWLVVLVRFKTHDQKRTRADALIQVHHQQQLFNINIKVKEQEKGPKVMLMLWYIKPTINTNHHPSHPKK